MVAMAMAMTAASFARAVFDSNTLESMSRQ